MTAAKPQRKNPHPPRHKKTRLTKAAIAALPIPADKYDVHWDAGEAGLAVRVMPTKRKVWFWQGRRHKVTLGRADLISPELARKKARALRVEVEEGGDPSARIKAAKQAKRAKAEKVPVHTLDALWRLYSAGALKDRRPQTQDAYAGVWRRLEPRIGNVDVAAVTTEQLQGLHGSISTKAGPYAANRSLAIISVLLSVAVKAKWRSDNPARGVERHTEHGREKYLSPEEIARLLAVLDQQDDLAAKAIEFLLLSGCRKGEALSASWGDFDLRQCEWTKPAHSTKANRVHRIPLSREAARLLTGLPTRAAERGPFSVLPAWRLHRRWTMIRKEAELEGVRIHDLRHSFASILVSAGLSLPVIGRLLGHSQPSTTARYAHVPDKLLHQATGKVGRAVRGKSNGVKLRPKATG